MLSKEIIATNEGVHFIQYKWFTKLSAKFNAMLLRNKTNLGCFTTFQL